MPVRIGNSYVSEAAAQFAQKAKSEDAEKGKKKSDTLGELSEKFPGLKFSVGTKPFQGSGMGNVSIAPNILKEMENDPAKREEYEALLYDVQQTTSEIQTKRGDMTIKAQGWIIDKDGGLSSWSIGVSEGGDRKPEAAGVRRTGKKAWWQSLLDEIRKKHARQGKTEKETPGADKEKGLMETLQAQQKEAAALLSGAKKNPFANTNEFSKYLQANFTVAKEGLTSISGKYLRECLNDEEKRQKLFDNLQAADEMLASRQGEVGFQGMRVRIDEDGEMTVESSKSTVAINENKSRRQIAAAATKGDMQAVLARLQQDLQAVEDGLKQNMCDGAEVEKAKKLIEQAKQRMAKLPDRAPTPEEQSLMAVNMLI
ncbi:MAG: hypothetical protein II178_08340 [Selenomonadaceae bacterium]|nr:hypothetical protein [Selenomonadaceae bacterium]